jgi:SpoVK/Ycf46/Vps4 family AAA+-type ATPase
VISKLSLSLSSTRSSFIECVGAHPLWFGTVAELKRPYIGQTEKVIKNIVNQCKKLPHLLCCLVIDEIDTLCSKRDEPGQPSHKSDWLSLLLRIMDSKDYPNLLIINCTNRKHMIDEAVLRPGRMEGKYYFGRLKGNEIIDLVKKL